MYPTLIICTSTFLCFDKILKSQEQGRLIFNMSYIKKLMLLLLWGIIRLYNGNCRCILYCRHLLFKKPRKFICILCLLLLHLTEFFKNCLIGDSCSVNCQAVQVFYVVFNSEFCPYCSVPKCCHACIQHPTVLSQVTAAGSAEGKRKQGLDG